MSICKLSATFYKLALAVVVFSNFIVSMQGGNYNLLIALCIGIRDRYKLITTAQSAIDITTKSY